MIKEPLFNYPPWSWLAVFVSFVSLVIATIALVVTWKTLKSQQRTEKNTRPLVNIEVQNFLFREMMIRLLNGYIMIHALWQLLNETAGKVYVPELLLDEMRLDESDIHVELYYDDSDKYRCLKGLLNEVGFFNKTAATLIDSQKEKLDIPEWEIKCLLQTNSTIFDSIVKVQQIVFGYDEYTIYDILDSMIDDLSDTDYSVDNNQELLFENCLYVQFFLKSGQEDKYKKMITFMKKTQVKSIKLLLNMPLQKQQIENTTGP